LIDDQQSQAINELINCLNPYLNLPKIDRIECYDISQLGAKYFVGSMTVWQNGQIDKNEYRHFKIKTKVSQDDQFMIREIIYRRLQHPEWQFPDLICVDGGKPQVSAADQAIKYAGVKDVYLIGLAKRLETIVVKTSHSWQEIVLPRNSRALLMLQSLRDEAHRFANKYRKLLISKSLD
jgi:excinuclease ABC subunit C